MSRKTTNYGYNISEGSDLVNPLVDIFPNWEAIDGDLKDVSDDAVGRATELTTGTVHALTRSDTDRNVFVFTATSNFTAGDTFTLDGTQVSALTPAGTQLATGCYIIGSDVLVAVHGTLMTMYVSPTKVADSDKLDGHDSTYFATASDLSDVSNDLDAVSDKVGTGVLTTDAQNCVGAINELNSDLSFKSITGLPSTAQESITITLPANFKEMELLIKVGGSSSWTLSTKIIKEALPTTGTYILREGQSFYYPAGQTRYDVSANIEVGANSVTITGSLMANNVSNVSTVLVSGWYR